jgi:hypothetical protein
MLVVNAPKITSTNTHTLLNAANQARPGLYSLVRLRFEATAMSREAREQKARCCSPQTL